MLKSYTQEWSNYSVLIQYLPTPFAFIERGVSRGQNGPRSDSKHGDTLFVVRDIMYSLWNGHVFETIQTNLLVAAMELIHKERMGESVDSKLIIGIRESFVNYGHAEQSLYVYTKYFEKQYIESCRNFYKNEASDVSQNEKPNIIATLRFWKRTAFWVT